jgi:hypothetical protein
MRFSPVQRLAKVIQDIRRWFGLEPAKRQSISPEKQVPERIRNVPAQSRGIRM